MLNYSLTVSEAVDKLLKEYIYRQTLKQTWHGIRSRDIWTLEVHDVLEANQDGIKKFVEWWIQTYSSKEGRKVLQLKDIKEMFAMVPRGEEKTLKDGLGLVEAGIVLSFANAKFLVIDEMTHANQLMTMKVDELYEFICRIADLAKLTGVGGWTTPPNEEADAHSDMEDVIPEGNEDNSASVMKTTAIQEPMGQQMLI